MRYCEKCGKNTEHKELMQPKPAQRPKTVTDFIKQFIALESRSYQVMDTDSLDRYIICEVCGTKRLENVGQEFE
jgi:DNA-directed RNA polymerase subunit RPC12/RpoP